MKRTLLPILCAATLAAAVSCGVNPENTTADAVADTQPRLPAMHYADSTRNGRKISKDPHVIRFKERYLMYYSMAPAKDEGWTVGIAESRDLTHWTPVAIMEPAGQYESKGFCAPCALVRDDTVHLFYQTYGNNEKDAICHAWSTDGIHFERDASNPIFAPEPAAWTCGRAIDAEVARVGDRYLMYYATRTTDYKRQIIGVAEAPADTDFSRGEWRQVGDGPVLKPEYPWEETCTEGASIVEHDGKYYMFYAGAYNNRPQQVGVAVSDDGIRWTKMSNKPFLANGDPGTWNSCESGHPHIFKDADGRTYLFYQGNDDKGKTWYLSNVEVVWRDGIPVPEQAVPQGPPL